MKQFEANDFNERMAVLKEDDKFFEVNDLYTMRSELEDYFQSGFCTLAVYKLFGDRIKQAIYLQGLAS